MVLQEIYEFWLLLRVKSEAIIRFRQTTERSGLYLTQFVPVVMCLHN